MQAEKADRVAGGLRGDFLDRPAERARYGARDVRHEGRLVAARLGLRLEVPGGGVGRVGLRDEALARDVAHQLQQVAAAALVADPAGDADVEVELDVRVQLVLFTSEAMRHGVSNLHLLEDLVGAGVRIPGMNEKRLAELEGEL